MISIFIMMMAIIISISIPDFSLYLKFTVFCAGAFVKVAVKKYICVVKGRQPKCILMKICPFKSSYCPDDLD